MHPDDLEIISQTAPPPRPTVSTETNGSDGLSAYQIAVNNGFSGSETEWLDSLKGERGENGTTTVNYAEYQEGYISREQFEGAPANNTFSFVRFPKAFSRKPDIFRATLDIQDTAVRVQYINNVTADGFSVATNYAASLRGVWYQAAVKPPE